MLYEKMLLETHRCNHAQDRTNLKIGNLHSLVPVAFHNGLFVDFGARYIAALADLEEC